MISEEVVESADKSGLLRGQSDWEGGLAIGICTEDKLFCWSRPTMTKEPQVIAEMLTGECRRVPDQILLVETQHGLPVVIETFTPGDDYDVECS